MTEEQASIGCMFLSALGGYVWGAMSAVIRSVVRETAKAGEPRVGAASPPRPFRVRVLLLVWQACANEEYTTSNGGPLGSCIDEERSELRDVVRVAEFSESPSI